MFCPRKKNIVRDRTPPCLHTIFASFTNLKTTFFIKGFCFVQVDGTFHRSSWSFPRRRENFHGFNGNFQLFVIPSTHSLPPTSIDFRLLPQSLHMLASATMSFQPYRRGGGRAASRLVGAVYQLMSVQCRVCLIRLSLVGSFFCCTLPG